MNSTNSSSPKLLLGYWGVRGRTQPIRYLLEYLQLPYEEKRYGENWEEWFAQDKVNLPAPFPNLPYIKDGDRVVTQSEAVYLYIAQKAGRSDLFGKTDDDQVTVSSTRWTIADLVQSVGDLAYNPEFEKIRDETLNEKVVPLLEALSTFLGQREFLHGYITYVDFIFYEILELLSVMKKEILEPFVNLGEYQQRFTKQQFMVDYINSDKFIKRPFFGPAVWNPME